MTLRFALSASRTIYPTGSFLRGTGAASGFSVNGNVLTFSLVSTTITTDVGQIRVLSLVPAPGASLALGGVTLTTLLRRRRGA